MKKKAYHAANIIALHVSLAWLKLQHRNMCIWLGFGCGKNPTCGSMPDWAYRAFRGGWAWLKLRYKREQRKAQHSNMCTWLGFAYGKKLPCGSMLDCRKHVPVFTPIIACTESVFFDWIPFDADCCRHM